MTRLLLVEDDDAISEPLCRALRRDGYEVDRATDGAAALRLAGDQSFDLVLLDLGLPDIDGLEVCRRLRSTEPQLPIVMLTARAGEVDAVVGLDSGADDYIVKPFRLAELLARLRARLRSRPGMDDAVLRVQDVVVDEGARRAWRGEEELVLTPKEFDLLAVLVGSAGSVVDRDQLMRDVWDEHWYGSTKTLDMHVSSLRRKLGDDAASPRYITTVRSVGLRFERG